MPNISYKGCETEISKHVGDYVIRAWRRHMSDDECEHDYVKS